MDATRQRHFVLVASLSVTALLVGCLVGGFVVWRHTQKQLLDPAFLRSQLDQLDAAEQRSDSEPTPAPVRVGYAAVKIVQPQRSFVGRLVEVQRVTVASEVTGKILELPVEEGSLVVGGETVLARIDDIWSRMAIARSKAQLASAEARLAYELPELERFEELRSKDAISQSALEEKIATVASLRAQVAEANASVEEEQERMQRSQIVAPFDGIVVVKHAERGGHVTPGTPLVEIVSRGEVDARLMVPESVVNRIQPGQQIRVRIDPLDEEASGTVVSVTAYGPSASRTFPVRVRLDDQGGRIKVGMSVTVLIPTGEALHHLVVTRDAVLVRPDGATVWVAAASGDDEVFTVEPVPVAVRVRLPHEYAVEPETSEGRALLAEGAAVVIEGAERLVPGQRVRIVAAGVQSTDVVRGDDRAVPSHTAQAASPVADAPAREER